MGKSLIIPRADFSQNSISEILYTNMCQYEDTITQDAISSYYTLELYVNNVSGVDINFVNIGKSIGGTLILTKVKKPVIGELINIVSSIDLNIIASNEPKRYYFETIHLLNDETIILSSSERGVYYFNNQVEKLSSDYTRMYHLSSNLWEFLNKSEKIYFIFNVDFGFE